MRLKALHHVRFQVLDLESSERFATDFGLIRVERTEDRLVMKTSGSDAYCYIAERNDHPRFAGFAFEVADAADLDAAVSQHGATPVETLGIGGGTAVTLTDPNGFRVDLIHGVSPAPSGEPYPGMIINSPISYPRRGRFEPKRPLGPAKLFRLGHIGLSIPSFNDSLPWYTEVLGLIPSDIYHIPGNPKVQIAGFLRLDHGDELVDHHCVALLQSMKGETDCHHISFEAQDFEAQFMSHRFLKGKGYEPVWGVGRHPHGSHIFDVWRDPDRNRFETFTDTDRLCAADGTRIHDIRDVEMDVWSSDPPDRYFA